MKKPVSQSFEQDFARSRWDIEFFSKRFLGITPHPGQRKLWWAIQQRDAQTHWRPRFLNIDVAAGNRAGKTLGIAIPLLHDTLFKSGMEPPGVKPASIERWMKAPYEAYHFAIAQEIAELAYIELQRILQGTHEAQKAGCPITDELGLFVNWEQKYRGEYLWMQIAPEMGGGNIHFRTTGEKAVGSLGKDMNLISYDEAGMDRNFRFVVDEVLNLRRLSTGGQLWVIGTATEGLNDFADHWADGDPDSPSRKPDCFSMRMSTRENLGYGIDQSIFDRIVQQVPIGLVPQNIDGFFIQARSAFFDSKSVDAMFIEGIPETQAAKEGHTYVQGVDEALRLDSTWSLVLDHDQSGSVAVGVRAFRHHGRATGPLIANIATEAHLAYSNAEVGSTCITGIDATGFGGAMFRDSLYITPLIAVQFGSTPGRKMKLLNDLRMWIEKGRLKFPRSGFWLEVRRQLLGYRLDDKHLETDAVMALAVAVHVMGAVPINAPSVAFDYFGFEDWVAVPKSGPTTLSQRDWARFDAFDRSQTSPSDVSEFW